MENRLDELFKNKLAHHATPLSGNAWQRVEGSLSKKNNFFAGWRIAAGVLLMAGLISALYWSQRSAVETAPNLSQRTTESSHQPEQKAQLSVKETGKPTTSIASSKSIQKKRVTTPAVVMEKESRSKVKTMVVASLTKVEPVIAEVTTPLEMSTTAEVAQVTKAEKTIVLEFTLAPIQPEVIARVEERNTGLKKLFTKARDLKNGESGLDLSDLTNKLFASNQKQTKDNIN